MVGLASAIRQLIDEKGIPEELVRKMIEEFLLAAYQRRFDTMENAVVQFSDDGEEVTLYAQKVIVEEEMDPVLELSLEDALELSPDCEVGDEILVEINPQDFGRAAVQSAKQKAKQMLRDIQKDTLYSEFKEKEGEMIIGYYQRERNGDIFVDLGKTEGLLPRRFQSPRESYQPNDRIKAVIHEVEKTAMGLRIILSRTHTDLVTKLFELEVPEIYDNSIEIFKIVREAGYRTKMAVYSHSDNIDPVGACVGMKGSRIQSVVAELEGEKIDVLAYNPDPVAFIANALSPAQVGQVVIVDSVKRHAVALVDESQLSLAIGRQGLNIRLANRLCDWNIDVKTQEQFAEMDIVAESRDAVHALFDGGSVYEEDGTPLENLQPLGQEIIHMLKDRGIFFIETLLQISDEELIVALGMDGQRLNFVREVVAENVVFEDELEDESEESANEPSEEAQAEEPQAEEHEEEEFACPECGASITLDMTACASCGVELSFEEVEEE